MTIYDIKLQFLAVNESTGPVTPVTKPYMVADYMKGAFDEFPEQEQVYVVLLDSRNNPKGRQRVTIGTQTMAPIHAREVFRAAIIGGATAIIVIHNHPSGDPAPSSADHQVTRQLREAGKTIGIELLDHVIIGHPNSDPVRKGYYSFSEAGIL